MTDVLCLGEILVDWVCTIKGVELAEAREFTKAPGGAPANVAVGLARQGMKAGFIGRVSVDAFGKWLKSILETEGIDTTGTVVDADAQTRMAYVVTLPNGDRKLAEFSKVSVADARLCPADLKEAQFAGAKALHFGSISMINKSSAEATRTAIELARLHNLLISFDPNVRIGLWSAPEVCKHSILSTLKYADLVKINIDELEFLTGSREFEAADKLRREHEIPLLMITLDSQGAYFCTHSGSQIVGGFKVQFVEATGAGDGFVSGILYGLVNETGKMTDKRKALTDLSQVKIAQIVSRANAIGALACTRPGAIPALPTNAEVKLFLEQQMAPISVSNNL